MKPYFSVNPAVTDLITAPPAVATKSPTVASGRPSVEFVPGVPAFAVRFIAVLVIGATLTYSLARRRRP